MTKKIMPTIEIEVPEYDASRGIVCRWVDGFDITVEVNKGTVTIGANKAGLLSLANHFLTLAQDDAPSGSHIHLDEDNSLEEGSVELVIVKE